LDFFVVKPDWVDACFERQERVPEEPCALELVNAVKLPRRLAIPAIYTQAEHVDFFSCLSSVREIK
jgi:hypothetical protein